MKVKEILDMLTNLPLAVYMVVEIDTRSGELAEVEVGRKDLLSEYQRLSPEQVTGMRLDHVRISDAVEYLYFSREIY